MIYLERILFICLVLGVILYIALSPKVDAWATRMANRLQGKRDTVKDIKSEVSRVKQESKDAETLVKEKLKSVQRDAAELEKINQNNKTNK